MGLRNVLLFVGVLFISAACQIQKSDVKPNVIYILADDLGYGDLSCYGQTKFVTPHIDQLARDGIRFKQHYSGSTVCAPSRSTLLSGQHTGHTSIRDNKSYEDAGQYPVGSDSPSIAKVFKSAGYRTGVFGKWGLGYPHSEGNPLAQGFDYFFGYNCQKNAHHYYAQHIYRNNDKVIINSNSGSQKGCYVPELIHQEVLQFIEDNKDAPFFLYYPTVIPHAEMLAPEEYMQQFRGKFLPEKEFAGYERDHPRYINGGYSSQPEGHAAFAAMVTLLDDQVGEVIAKCEALGISENTLIIFTSDNGPHQAGGHDPQYWNSSGGLRGKKQDLYEGGIRVPMIAKWPKYIQPYQETNHISAFWDVLPTMADIAGVEKPDKIDGISFLPTLLGEKKQENHEYLYWEYRSCHGRKAVRMGDWKAVQYNIRKKDNAPIELYNLKTDPAESNNVAQEYPEILKKMGQIMKTARSQSDLFEF